MGERVEGMCGCDRDGAAGGAVRGRRQEAGDAHQGAGADHRVRPGSQEAGKPVPGCAKSKFFPAPSRFTSPGRWPSTELLTLVYQSLRALLKESIPDELVRRIFELKTMVLNGEYTELPPLPVSDSACYTWEYVTAAPLGKLYTFTVTAEVLAEFGRCVDEAKRRFLPHHFRSLDILEAVAGP